MLRSFAFLFILIAFAAGARADILSYDSWRAERVSQAKIKYDRVMADRKKEGGLSPETNSRLRKARTNLVMAEELTANDYFQHYLSPIYGNQVKALQFVVKKMKPTDLAEILMAYSAQLKEAQQAPVAPPPGWLNEAEPTIAEKPIERPIDEIGAAKQ